MSNSTVTIETSLQSAAQQVSQVPTGLMVNLLNDPLGVNTASVRFSWLVPQIGDEPLQSAYQIQVSQRQDGFTEGQTLVWDSGKIAESSSTSLPYDGPQLNSDAAYFWRVRVYLASDETSGWSEPQRLITAAKSGDWKATAIWAAGTGNASAKADPYNWLLARRTFNVSDSSKLSRAWIRVTAQSPESARQYVYKLWLNGKLVGLGPVRAQYANNQEARYNVYDITALLTSGNNALAALCYADTNRAFMLDLIVQDSDGNKSVVCSSDTTWKAKAAGGWLPDNGLLNTRYYKAPYEYIDARREPIGWLEAGYDDAAWSNAVSVSTIANLKPAMSDNMVLLEQAAVNVSSLGKNHWLFDLGREIVGGIRLDIEGKEGVTLDIRLGEEKTAGGGARYQLRSGLTYREMWTLRDGKQQLEHWGYRAFRWVEIIASGDVDVSQAFKVMVLKMPWDESHSSFKSSDDNLNKIYDFCRYTIEGTRQDLYQDTPTRERGPYEGDAIINQLSEYYTQRSWSLPRYSSGYFARRRTWPTEYFLVPPVLAWNDYLHTGDSVLLSEDYEELKKHTFDSFINSNGLVEKNVGQSSVNNGDLVDWPSSNRDNYDFQRINTVINSWQYASYDALAKIANILGKTTERDAWRSKATRLKTYVVNHFISDSKLFADGYNTSTQLVSTHRSQHATAFSLALGLAEGSTLTASGKALADDIANRGIKVSVYGAQFLLEALFKAGLATQAIKALVNTTEYSWLHMIEAFDATMVMEAWDPAMKSNTTFSHAWGTAPANVIPRFIAGVQVAKPGAAEVLIAPNPGELASFTAQVPVIRGVVTVEFNRENTTLFTITLPPNTQGQLKLDLSQLAGIDAGKLRVVGAKGTALSAVVKDNVLEVNALLPGTTTIVRV